jgi:hypothetical protein
MIPNFGRREVDFFFPPNIGGGEISSWMDEE